MTSRLLYENLPVYAQWFDQVSGSVLAHLCNAIQPEFDLIAQVLEEYEYFVNLNSPLNDNYLDFLQQFIGAAPIEDRYLGIGLNPDWPSAYKKRVLAQLFPYWQRKGTESGVRSALEMWLRWFPEFDDDIVLHYPFGAQITATPTNWWQWGTSYDQHLYQDYRDRQHFGGGDEPGFLYQPSGLQLREFTNRWQWAVEPWSLRELTADLLPIIANSKNQLGPGQIHPHLRPGLSEFPTWNRIFNDCSTLLPEIVPSTAQISMFQWLEFNAVEHPVIGLDPQLNRRLEIDYELDGYEWGDLELWPWPGLSQTRIKKIERINHDYQNLGWQWQADWFAGTSTIRQDNTEGRDVEFIVEGSWGTRYGDLTALTPFFIRETVQFEIVTLDNFESVQAFWVSPWLSGIQWFHAASQEWIEVSRPSFQPSVDLSGSVFPLFKETEEKVFIYREIPAGFGSDIQLWGGALNAITTPHPNYEPVPVFEYGSSSSVTHENPAFHPFVLASQQGNTPAELWGTSFIKKNPISIINIELDTEAQLLNQDNSAVSLNWAVLASEELITRINLIPESGIVVEVAAQYNQDWGLDVYWFGASTRKEIETINQFNPSPHPWVWIFNQINAEPQEPIIIDNPGLTIDQSADFLEWNQLWYYPSTQQIIIPPPLLPDSNLIGNYSFIFNQGHQWPNNLTRPEIRQTLPTFESEIIHYPSVTWFYPPKDIFLRQDWVNVLDPTIRVEQEPQFVLKESPVTLWSSGASWMYRNPSGQEIERIEIVLNTESIVANPWFYNFKQWIEWVILNPDQSSWLHTTPGQLWYAFRSWTEWIETIIVDKEQDQCFLGKFYDHKIAETIIEETVEIIEGNLILNQRQIEIPAQIIKPGFAGIIPGQQWNHQWLVMLDQSFSLLEIDLQDTIEAFGEIDLEDWTQATLDMDLNSEFKNLVYRVGSTTQMEKIIINEDCWFCKPIDAVIIPPSTVVVIESDQINCARYSDPWLKLCEWATLVTEGIVIVETSPVYQRVSLCNIPDFYSLRQLKNYKEEWIILDPDLSLFEEFPEFKDWFDAKNWVLLLETQGRIIRDYPTTILWRGESGNNVYYSEGDILQLEFLNAILETDNRRAEGQIRSVALLFQDRCIHFQTAEHHGKLNTRSDYTFGSRYRIQPKFEAKNYITVDAEILI